jgi:hypothetical protein
VPHLRDGRWQADARLRLIELPQAEARQIALVQARESPHAALVGTVVREFQARLQG